jgi:hypothetical protein
MELTATVLMTRAMADSCADDLGVKIADEMRSRVARVCVRQTDSAIFNRT